MEGGDLLVAVSKLRPSGATVPAVTVVERFQERPASEWGMEYAAFLRRNGASHLTATVVLPRRDLIVRVVNLPGVKDADLASAIGFQLDSLHPYPEDQVVCDWARIGKSASVLVAIARQETIAEYSNRFAEAGVAVASFTCSAAVLYAALRAGGSEPAAGFLTLFGCGEEREAYGESEAHALFSTQLDAASSAMAARAVEFARAELRLAGDAEPGSLETLLPAPQAAPEKFQSGRYWLAYAASLAGAASRRTLRVNLLPNAQRKETSKLIYLPTILLGTVFVLLVLANVFYPEIEEARFRQLLQAEVNRLRPAAQKADQLDQAAQLARKKVEALDRYRRQTPLDLEALNELTRLLQPPVWLSGLDMDRNTVNLGGEGDQSTTLLKLLDQSPYFVNSDFTMPLSRMGGAEVFRIRTSREVPKAAPANPAPAAAVNNQPPVAPMPPQAVSFGGPR
jgi:Tfp pilus assembly protein PilN